MQYNVSFEVCAAIMLTIFTVFSQLGNPVKSKQNTAYVHLSVCIIATCFMDITSSLIINRLSVESNIPLQLAYAVNILYFIFTGINGYYFCCYLHTLTNNKNSSHRVRFILLSIPEIAFSIFAALTPYTKLLFYFDENNNYRFGEFHILSNVIMGFYMAAGLAYMLAKKDCFTPLQLISGVVYTIAAASGMLIQTYLTPNVCIGFAAAAIAVMMLYFALQLPDPFALMNALDELKRAKEEIEDTSKAKEDFLRHISHEMRTPVNSMLGMNEMILRKCFDEQIVNYAETSEKSGKILLHLIDNILDYTQLSSGNVKLNIAEYSVKELFEELITDTNHFLEHKDVKLVTEISHEIPCLLIGDIHRIKQIIANLLSNAVKFTENGQIKLSVHHMPSGAEHMKLIVSVADTGCGIKEEDLMKMSGSFIRIDEQKNVGIEGAGLGLSVTKLLLELMNGHIDIQSVYGKGSTFTVEIMQKISDHSPVGEITAFTNIRNDKQISFTAPEADVLLTDDSEVNLFVLHEFLKQFGINADVSGSGTECFELASQKNYDIIFLDHMMPDPDGIQTLSMIKNTSGCASSGSAVVVVTANAVTGVREQYLAEGFSDYISKPINFELLGETLLKFLPQNKIIYHSVSSKPTSEADIMYSRNISHINTSEGLSHYHENRIAYAEALESFAVTASDISEKLKSAADNCKPLLYADAAKKLENLAFNIGARDLSDMAKLQKIFARSGKLNDIITLHYDFVTAIQNTADEALKIYDKIKS